MSKSDGTPVRCLECGHEWETVAEYPQCSDPNDECGRSRNVEPVSELEGGANGSPTGGDERDPASSGDSQTESEWNPLFDTQESETEPVEDMSMSEPPELGDSPAGAQADSPDGEEPEFAEEQIPDLEPEDIRFFVKTPFDMASRTRGEYWELSDEELDQLSHAYARVGNKYMPHMMKEHAPEVLAAMTTASVVGPRVAQDKSEAEESDESERDTESLGGGDRRGSQNRGNSDGQTQQNQSDSFAYDKL